MDRVTEIIITMIGWLLGCWYLLEIWEMSL